VTPYYADDLVTIYHGDCREWMPEADVIVTDPPYGIGWDANGGGSRSRARDRRSDPFAPIIGDDLPFNPTALLSLGRPTVLFGANHYASRLPDSPSWFVWDKRVLMASNDQADCEMAWTNLGGPARIFRLVWNGGGSQMLNQRDGGGHPFGIAATVPKVLHPSAKPVSLMRWVIGRCPLGTIIDPYMGSGTTLVAAKSLGRHAIGIEIEERYCETAANRCRQEVLGLVG
jgi:site-specific DNA-methyltransferase (adenine-specific)